MVIIFLEVLSVRRKWALYITSFCLLGIMFSCDSNLEVEVGEKLVNQHCGSCHQVPKPEALDKSTWDKIVLPRMAAFMGVNDSLKDAMLKDPVNGPQLSNANFFPKKPMVSDREWKQIEDYIVGLAPESLTLPSSPEPQLNPAFRLRIPDYYLSPSTTMVKITRNGNLLIADANSQKLYQFDAGLDLEKAASIMEGGVSMIETSNQI